MRTPEEHVAAVRELIGRVPRVDVPVTEAVGRRLLADARAEVASPRFDNSQMDGYAVDEAGLRRLPGRLAVGPTVATGADPDVVVPDGVAGRAVPVMTGAKLPEQTVAVVPVEACRPPDFSAAEQAGGVWVPETTRGRFVRAAGSDVPAGTLLAARGTVVDPVLLAALINSSVLRVTVRHRTRVLLVTGGAEITDTDTAPDETAAATIPDSNGPMLAALCRDYGMEPVGRVRTNDDPEALRADLSAAVDKTHPDLIVTSGGISHGRFEVVRILLDGPDAWFGHVAQQPGGPQGLAVFAGVPVVCLPGNPVSTLVSFRLFVAAVAGDAPEPVSAELTEPLAGLDDARVQLRRAKLTDLGGGRRHVRPVGGTGSHLISQAIGADCLVAVPPAARLDAGQTVRVHPFRTPAS